MSKYKDLKFKNEQEFEKWLELTAKYVIDFEDKGQDFLTWYLAEDGEVLHSRPFQANVWNGSIVLLSSLEVGQRPLIQSNKKIGELNYKVVKIHNKPKEVIEESFI